MPSTNTIPSSFKQANQQKQSAEEIISINSVVDVKPFKTTSKINIYELIGRHYFSRSRNNVYQIYI